MGTPECGPAEESLYLNVRQRGTFHSHNLLSRTHEQVLFPFRIDEGFPSVLNYFYSLVTSISLRQFILLAAS
jgi:hypothetical protein